LVSNRFEELRLELELELELEEVMRVPERTVG